MNVRNSTLSLFGTLGIASLLVGCGGDDTMETASATATMTFSGTDTTESSAGEATTADTTADATSGDGDTGDGDGATGDGDGATGDGDGTTGDGDGTTGDGTTGDGDGSSGDGTTGDGDGTTGDGDGTTGDGDGTTGDGDGTTGDGDGTSGDGDGTTGDGDGTTGDGDGTTGDGDGSTGDGDGSTGDGDGSTGDGDGSTGDGDGSTGDGDGSTGDGTTGDGDGTTGDGDGDGDGDGACLTDPFTAAPAEPYVVLVLDKSGSMFDTLWDDDSNGVTPDVSRWSSLYSVVDSVLTNFEDQVYFGGQVFPKPGATAGWLWTDCLMPSQGETIDEPIALLNRTNILGLMPASTTPSGDPNGLGGTPAQRAMELAMDHLAIQDPSRERFAIFVTDGAANCDLDLLNSGGDMGQVLDTYDQALHTVVQNGFTNDGIRTYVVGIDIIDAFSPVDPLDGAPDNVNAFDKLNELANLGGTPRGLPAGDFYNAADANDLLTDLSNILTQLQSCTIPLVASPPNPNMTTVDINGTPVPMVGDCTTENGWVYVEPMEPYMNIELCGTACTDLQTFGEATVQFFCDAG